MNMDCILWTLGAFCNPRKTADQVGTKTGYMVGAPLSFEQATDIINRLDLGSSLYLQHASLDAALEAIGDTDGSYTKFALAYTDSKSVGHMLCVFRPSGTLSIEDTQPTSAFYGPACSENTFRQKMTNLYGASTMGTFTYYIWAIS